MAADWPFKATIVNERFCSAKALAYAESGSNVGNRLSACCPVATRMASCLRKVVLSERRSALRVLAAALPRRVLRFFVVNSCHSRTPWAAMGSIGPPRCNTRIWLRRSSLYHTARLSTGVMPGREPTPNTLNKTFLWALSV